MEKQNLEPLILAGYSLNQISKESGMSLINIRYWLKKFDLKLKRGARGKKPKDFSFPRKCACGETDPNLFYGNKTTICAKCHCKSTLSKGQDNRKYMLAVLGGQCINCGFDKWKASLDIHHLDPSKKDVAFSVARYWSKDKIDKELKKCVLLCRNCHAAHHSGELINDKLSGYGV